MSKDVKEAEELLSDIEHDRAERRNNSTLACYETAEDDQLSRAVASNITRTGTTMQTYRTGGGDVTTNNAASTSDG